MDYKNVYNDVYVKNPFYVGEQYSPGYRNIRSAIKHLKDSKATVPGDSHFDFGCGCGYACGYMYQQGYKSTGYDVSTLAVDKANKLNPGPVYTTDRPNSKFSIVTSFDVLEHLEERDVLPTIAFLNQRVRLGGYLILSISTRLSSHYDMNGNNLHLTVWSKEKWLNILNPLSCVEGKDEIITISKL